LSTKSSSLFASIWSYIHDGRRSTGEPAFLTAGLISITSQPPSETPCHCVGCAAAATNAPAPAASGGNGGAAVLHMVSAIGASTSREAAATFCHVGTVRSQ